MIYDNKYGRVGKVPLSRIILMEETTITVSENVLGRRKVRNFVRERQISEVALQVGVHVFVQFLEHVGERDDVSNVLVKPEPGEPANVGRSFIEIRKTDAKNVAVNFVERIGVVATAVVGYVVDGNDIAVALELFLFDDSALVPYRFFKHLV